VAVHPLGERFQDGAGEGVWAAGAQFPRLDGAVGLMDAGGKGGAVLPKGGA
jgi:hypothetical protein